MITFFQKNFIDRVDDDVDLKVNYSKIKKEVSNFWKDEDSVSEDSEPAEAEEEGMEKEAGGIIE